MIASRGIAGPLLRVVPGILVAVAVVTAHDAAPIGAQSQQTPVFRSRTDLVELDVSVLDKNRRPVRGLGTADFAVFEDGQRQEVSIFEAIDVPDPEPPPVAWMRDVTPDVTTNEERVTRLWVIAVDDALIPTDPAMMRSARKIIEDIIDKLGPEDLAAMVFTADSRKAQDFTNDRSKLRATLDGFNPGFAIWTQGADNTKPPIDADLHLMIGSVATVLNIVDTLKAIPNERKGLIWITPGVPYDAVVTDSPLMAPNYEQGGGLIVGGQDAHIRIKSLTKDVFESARLANIPVYPIDPCGLNGLEFWLRVGGRAAPKSTRSMDHILLTAANTGGHAIVNTNDFTPGIDSIFEENKSYYRLGYYPTNARTDGTLRKIDVKVERENVTVRARSGYYAPKPGEGAPRNTNAQLATAMSVPIPVADLPMRAALAPFAIPGKGHLAAVTIVLGVRQPVPASAAAGRVTVSTDLQVTAFTTEGDKRGTQRSVAKVLLRAGAAGDAEYEALSRIDLPPGRYRLRLAAYHEAAAKAGTVMADVLVPDFNRDLASMSGVVIGVTPGRPSAPRDLFKDVLPLVPTAQRAFGPREQATALFALYQNAGKGVTSATVVTRITDAHDAVLINETQTLAADRFIAATLASPAPAASPIVGGTRSIPSISRHHAWRPARRSFAPRTCSTVFRCSGCPPGDIC